MLKSVKNNLDGHTLPTHFRCRVHVLKLWPSTNLYLYSFTLIRNLFKVLKAFENLFFIHFFLAIDEHLKWNYWLEKTKIWLHKHLGEWQMFHNSLWHSPIIYLTVKYCFTWFKQNLRKKGSYSLKRDGACCLVLRKTPFRWKKDFFAWFLSITDLTALVEELSRKICPSSNGKICIPWKSSSIAKFMSLIRAML